MTLHVSRLPDAFRDAKQMLISVTPPGRCTGEVLLSMTLSMTTFPRGFHDAFHEAAHLAVSMTLSVTSFP